MKLRAFDWSQFETVPFAVVFWSSVVGWIVMSKPLNAEAAHASYDACDYNNKKLLNYGMIVREVEP